MSLLQAINDAEEELTKDKGWATNQFPVNIATSYSDDTPKQIDIMITLGHKTRQPKKTKQKRDSPKYWLPSKFNQNTDEFRKEYVVPYFSNAALDAGFGLVARGWQDDRNYLKLQCERGRHYESEKRNEHEKEIEQSSQSKDTISKAKVATTKRAVKGEEDKCPFYFNVWWDEECQRWYLPLKQLGCSEHKGHMQRSVDIAPARSTNLTQEEQKLIFDLNEANIAFSSLTWRCCLSPTFFY